MRKKTAKKELMVKRKVRLKKRRKRFLLTSITILTIAIISTLIFYKLYIDSKCKDLTYSINYNLENKSDKSMRLLSLEDIDLIFKDDDSAIALVSGLTKESPHTNTSIKGYFKKSSFGVWNLNNTTIENSN